MSVIDLHTACRESGVSLTTEREFIYESLISYPGGFSTNQLVERVRRAYPSISRSLVHTSLLLFCEMGLLRESRQGSEETYFLVPENEKVAGSHFRCSYCNRAVEIPDEQFTPILWELAYQAGFALSHHQVVGFGLCKSCRKSGGFQ